MTQVHRVGDSNDAGGVITGSLQSSVFANGILVSVDGSPVSPHLPFVPPHVGTITASGSGTVSIEGIPVNRLGDADSCGHSRAAGSDNVFVG